MTASQEPQPQESKAEQQPLLKVIDHNATPEEIAAIVAVFAALGSAGEAAKKKPRSLWATPQLRTPLHPGPNAWRASGLPR
ncbi:acyl-CoA carboxylase epsilon subunit [Nocardioides sp. NPDC058538]|uniref:acyl-CoA carboxylase epsilon subunit n=1 Tax=Nocardioides sp. NPDC058538 TaxID=3346542 RepID=UPI0036502437